jgi:hypothetical protein
MSLGEASRFDHGMSKLAKARGGANPHFSSELIFESSINPVKK